MSGDRRETVRDQSQAFIAVGRDLSLVNVFRPPPLDFSDMTVGKEIIRAENENVSIRWVTTPGHTADSCSLLLTGKIDFNGRCDLKNLALVGDLWDFENDDELWRDMSADHQTQIRSRNFVGQTVVPDCVVPGHGPPFFPPFKQY